MASWSYATRIGTFMIEGRDDGLYHVRLGDELLGNYHSPHAAAEILFSGLGVEPRAGNTGWLGIPRDLTYWTSHD